MALLSGEDIFRTGGTVQTVIYRITDALTGSNCYLIPAGKDCLIIDPNDFSRIDRLLRHWKTERILAMLTHEHCDHIAGLNQLRSNYGATVLASSDCSLRIQSIKTNMSGVMEVFLYYKTKTLTVYEPFVCTPAEILFEERIEFSLKQMWIELRQAPGHTPGSSLIWLTPAGCRADDRIVFSGDYLIPGEAVNTRLPGGDETVYQEKTRGLLRSIADGSKIFPGHGKPFEMDDEVRRTL